MTEKQFKVKKIYGSGYYIEDRFVGYTWKIASKVEAEGLAKLLNQLSNENKQLKCNNQKAIDLIYDAIVEMHDGKRDYAETLLHKAIELIK